MSKMSKKELRRLEIARKKRKLQEELLTKVIIPKSRAIFRRGITVLLPILLLSGPGDDCEAVGTLSQTHYYGPNTAEFVIEPNN